MENTGLKGLGITLWQRVILSYRTTLLGIGVVALGVVVDAMLHSPSKIVTTIAGILGLVLSMIKEQLPAPPPPSNPGFARVGLLMLLAALCCTAVVVRADEPKFGGCLLTSDTCFGPTVSINVMAISLKTGDVTTQFSPGIGYGAVFKASQWYRTGLSLGFALRSFEGRTLPQLSVLGTFAEYIRIGVAGVFGAGDIGKSASVLLGFGSDFGSTPSQGK